MSIQITDMSELGNAFIMQEGEALLTALLILGVTQLQSRGLLCILGLPSVTTAGTGDIQPMYVALKALSARNVVDHTEWKTIDL